MDVASPREWSELHPLQSRGRITIDFSPNEMERGLPLESASYVSVEKKIRLVQTCNENSIHEASLRGYFSVNGSISAV